MSSVMNPADRLRGPDDRPVDKQAPDTRSLRASLNNISIRLPARRSSRTSCGAVDGKISGSPEGDRLAVISGPSGVTPLSWS